jgi:non-heme chloroperoxidase
MKQNPFRVFKQGGGGLTSGLVESTDGAHIYVETRGEGQPILLVHGWTMSSRFWCRQMEALSRKFQVVTMDLRAHGNSSKILHGHTLPQYAKDVHTVIEALGLEKTILVGWSLAGPVALEYWRRFGNRHISALGLVEMTPFPFSPGAWNTHALKGYRFDGMNLSFKNLQMDRRSFAEKFIHSMFKEGRALPEELEWMVEEHMKAPTPVAMAIYSDYIMRDYTEILPTVSVPSLAVYGISNHLSYGREMGRYVLEQMPNANLLLLEKSGHLPFYEQPEEFNKALAALAENI